MEIIWHGHSFFEIKSRENKNQVRIAIDPFSEEVGLKVPKIETDILLISHDHYDHNNKNVISGNYFLIDNQGEYEVKGVFIKAIKSFHDKVGGKERGENLMFLIETEDLRVCHMGDFGQKELSEKQLDEIGGVDILMIPVGGVYTISAKEAIKVLEQLEPKITIPMHYSLPKLKIKLDSVDKFLKSLGIKSLTPEKKLSIKKEDLSPEEAKIVLLEPR
jgi:L-ascorbate metabolism protein UlaG (beta-lactamase superfamily)